MTFRFNSVQIVHTINIPIINDDIFELTEELQVGLRFAGPAPPDVLIKPARATVTIIDDDSEIDNYRLRHAIVQEKGSTRLLNLYQLYFIKVHIFYLIQ